MRSNLISSSYTLHIMCNYITHYITIQYLLILETWLDRSIWMGGVSGKPDIVNPDKKCLAYHVGKINGWIDMDCSTKYYYACQIYINP